MPRSCVCGASLVCEERVSFGPLRKRHLALCENEACGHITTESTDGHVSALQDFLLDDEAPVRYLRPWVRLFIRTIGQGSFNWKAADEACPDCQHELNLDLTLTPLYTPPHTADPRFVRICLVCGATHLAFWVGRENLTLAMPGSAWNNPDAALCALRRSLEIRTRAAHDPGTSE